MKSLTILSALALASLAAAAPDWYAYTGVRVGAGNFSLHDGSPEPDSQMNYDSPDGLASDTKTLGVSGTGTSATGSSTTSVGVIKADVGAYGQKMDLEIGGKKVGGASAQAGGRWFDTLTVLTPGFLNFTWDVTGSATKDAGGAYGGDGRFQVLRADFSHVGTIDLIVHATTGGPVYQVNGGPVGAQNSFLGVVNAGDKLLISARMGIVAYGGYAGAEGGANVDYGHSAYALVQDAFNSGATFTSASGYRYGAAPVPEPASFAPLGLGALALLRPRLGRARTH